MLADPVRTEMTATWIDGFLKPDEPLELPNHARVKVRIERVPRASEPVAAWESLKRRLN